MNKIYFMLAILLASVNSSLAQKWAVKSNLLYDATATINLGVEAALGPRVTLDISGNYNPWEFGDARWKHWLIQPEVRYWLCERFNRHLTRKLTLTARHDVMQLGAGQNALTESNILSSILSRGDQRLSMVNRGEAVYEHEWCHGVSTFAGARMQRIFANRYVPMLRPDGVPVNSVSDAAVHVGLRLSKNETVYRMPFDKQSMGSVYPILTLGFSAGIPDALHGSYEYYRLEGGIRYRPELPPVGYSDITVQGGRIFGKVPYQLLKLHEGNGTYFYDPYAFSCMNFYEFASDAWVSWFWEHHFNGVLLGRLPLIKKLKWREVLVCKGVWGTLSRENNGSTAGTQADLLFPAGMTSVSDPYVEAGFGVENIFRLFRVDCIWRLTHRSPKPGQEIQNFAVNLSLQLKF